MRKLQPLLLVLVTACATQPSGFIEETPDSNDDALAPSVDAGSLDEDPPPPIDVELCGTYQAHPHDDRAFTQGLVTGTEYVFESTGNYEESSLRKTRLDGTVEWKILLSEIEELSNFTPAFSRGFFAEGLALVDNRLIQLTWKSEIALVWDLETLTPDAPHPTIIEYGDGDPETIQEGWGLTYDKNADRLIMSDGSDTLLLRHPQTFEEIERVAVTQDGEPLDQWNELEWIDGVVLANRWFDDKIYAIDPDTGIVLQTLEPANFSEIRSTLDTALENDPDHVMNGIADLGHGRVLLTGKGWAQSFGVALEIRGCSHMYY